MKPTLLWLLICIGVARVANTQTSNPSSANANATNNAATTNQFIEITNTLSFEYDGITGVAVWRGDVFVNDPQMTIQCDLLTAHFATPPKTNAAPAGAVAPPKAADAKPAASGKTNSDAGFGFGGKIESIVAEGQGHRVVVVQKRDNTTATGEKAVYSADTDTVVLTGEPTMETPQKGQIWAPRIVLDRAHNSLTTDGPTRIIFNSSSMGRTNLNSNPKPPKQTQPPPTPTK